MTFLLIAKGLWQCGRLARKVEAKIVRAGLRINVPKCHTLPAQKRRQMGLDVDFADGIFRVQIDRWEALHESVEGLVGRLHGRVQASRMASLTGTVISMHLSWRPAMQLYTRHLYALISSMRSLN